MASAKRQPAIYISHGGGPGFFLDAKEYPMFAGTDKDSKTAHFLRGLAATLPEKPKAVLIISGHWEARTVSVNTSPAPPMLYDYGGFPEETYHIDFPAKGNPALAQRTASLLRGVGIEVAEDSKRGFDHGVFVPLKLVFPSADVPIVELSMHASYDPALHIKMGQALAPLRDEGVLILGSGSVTHNMGGFRSDRSAGSTMLPWAKEFVDWLTAKLGASDPAARVDAMLNIESAPNFRKAHPQEDHFVPLYTVVGASAPAVALAVPKLGKVGVSAASSSVSVQADGSVPSKTEEWPGAKKIHDGIMGGQSLAAYRFD